MDVSMLTPQHFFPNIFAARFVLSVLILVALIKKCSIHITSRQQLLIMPVLAL